MKRSKNKNIKLKDEEILRFSSKVKRCGANECWPWTHALLSTGYGVFSVRRSRTSVVSYKSHRVAYFLATGRDPGDLLVMHSCDNRPCCNPAHLTIGTERDNIYDMIAKGRQRYLSGRSHWNAKLSSAQIIEIQNKYANGDISQRDLASIYNVSQGCISYATREKIT